MMIVIYVPAPDKFRRRKGRRVRPVWAPAAAAIPCNVSCLQYVYISAESRLYSVQGSSQLDVNTNAASCLRLRGAWSRSRSASGAPSPAAA